MQVTWHDGVAPPTTPVSGGPARVTELMSGEVDALGWATPAELRRLNDDQAFRAYHTYSSAYRAIVWNATHASR